MIQPLTFYKFHNGIRFFLVNCGSGLTHLIIFPDDTVMLFDCNLVDDEERTERNKDYILKLFRNVIPFREDENGEQAQWIDIFVNSHRDTDHLRGLKDVNESFPVHSIWDSGQSGATTSDSNYQYYMGLRNRLKQKDENNLVVPVPSNKAFREYGGAEIYVLSDARDFVFDEEVALNEYADREQHTNCMVLLIYYAGRKMLLTGDSDWKAWRDNIVPNFEDADVNYKNTDILIASHHGSRTFFTNKDEIDEDKYPDDTYVDSIKQIKPSITLISCGDYEQYHHPSEDAMEIYEDNTFHSQVYTTNKHGTFCGLIGEDGHYSVTPSCFYNYGGVIGQRVLLSCKTDRGEPVESGDTFPVGRKLTFTLTGIGGVLTDSDNPLVWWEVCNAGYSPDDRNHEIYYKEKDEGDGKYSFSRDLSYVGTHLLRCRVRNRKKHFEQQIVFIVNGQK